MSYRDTQIHADAVEADGGYILKSMSTIEVRRQRLTLEEGFELLKELNRRAVGREEDKSEDYKAARRQGYEAALRAVEHAIKAVPLV